MTLVFDPVSPAWVLGFAIALGAIAALISIARHWRSGIFRAAAIAFLLTLFANPQWRETERTPLDNIAIIVVDESASQNLDGRAQIAAEAANALEARLNQFNGLDVKLAVNRGEDETRLIDTLRAALGDTPRAQLGGVFIISDGQTVDAAQADDLALATPVHFLSTGHAGEIDRKITLTNAPRYGLVREKLQISFRVDDIGKDDKIASDDKPVAVMLRIDGEEVLRQPVPLGIVASFDAPA